MAGIKFGKLVPRCELDLLYVQPPHIANYGKGQARLPADSLLVILMSLYGSRKASHHFIKPSSHGFHA